MSHGHSVHIDGDHAGLVADEDSTIVNRLSFERDGETFRVSVDLRQNRSDGLVYMSATEVMRLSKALRSLAIAAFEAG